MELTTITMDRNAARKAFLEYRAAFRETHEAQDAKIMRGYRELAKGRQLISLPETIKAGGYHVGARDEIVPNLAIVRASADFVYLRTWTDGSCLFSEEQSYAWRAKKAVRRLPAGTLPAMDWNQTARGTQRALVPIIPPEYRPPYKLENYHILFEAEWKPQPPVDPVLLKHIGGDLYAVLAAWDLTEVERAVLAERFAF